MLIAFHIIIALTSLAYTTFMYFSPSSRRLIVSYYLGGLTIASGTYLAWASKAHIVQACLSGLAYLGIIAILIFLTQRKLASTRN